MRPFARKAKVLPFDVEQDLLVLHPTGDMLAVGESVVEQEIADVHAAVSDNDIKRLVVDVGDAPHFGSLVMGALLTICLRVVELGGQVAMCQASESMRESLGIMKVDTVIPYHDTLELALAAVSDSE